MRADSSTIDQRLQDRLASDLDQVLAGRTVVDPLTDDRTDREAVAKEVDESDSARDEVAPALGTGKWYVVLAGYCFERFGLDERDLTAAVRPRLRRVETGARLISVAGQSAIGQCLDRVDRDHCRAGGGRDVNLVNVAH
jgi:hypothetical protein